MAYVIRIRAPRQFHYVLLLRKSFFHFYSLAEALQVSEAKFFLRRTTSQKCLVPRVHFSWVVKMAKPTENIFMFVPNLIGYGRIILAIISFYYMPTNHIVASWCYILSGFLDAFDGHAARHFNQSTRFGAMLDMLTDR